MSAPTSSHAYGIGVIAIIIGASIGVIFYTSFYLPESLLTPSVDEHVLHPIEEAIIKMIDGSAIVDQQDNFVPKLVDIQLGINNHVIWVNDDSTAHTVTPDHRTVDSYSGPFGSVGVISPGEKYEFLFTEPNEITYHCEPHPWMTGTLSVTKQRF